MSKNENNETNFGYKNVDKSEKPEIIEQIQSTGKLEEKIEKLLSQTIEEYKKGNK